MQVDRLVPHRPPLCLVNELLEFSGQTGLVGAIVGADNLFLEEDGSISPVILTEFIAQAAAAVKGYDDLKQGKDIKRGFLVDIREINFKSKCFKGDRLAIRIEIVRTFSGFSIINGEVERDGKTVALATLKLWVPEEALP
jgi:3-hydroxyacyl-[acyl-carrier-protein] dehydratase